MTPFSIHKKNLKKMVLKTVQFSLSFNYDESFIQVNLDCC